MLDSLLARFARRSEPPRPSWPAPIPENWHEEFIVHLAGILRPNVYVELGLYQCELFNRVVPYARRLIGVDVNDRARTFMDRTTQKTTFFHGTTDAFVESLKRQPLQIDLLFIDADHSKESVKRDFENFFPYVTDHGVILLHDSFPKDSTYAQPQYCGDGYKAIAELARRTDAYEMATIPIHPGLTICRKRTRQLNW